MDLSAKMLDKARARLVYQRLEHADLLAMMRLEESTSYDVLEMRAAPLRTENNQPVNGYLGLWRAVR